MSSLLVKRNGLEPFLHDSTPVYLDQNIVNESGFWEKLWRRFEDACFQSPSAQKGESWSHLAADGDVAARRYARLLVSEIKLYHESAVADGRRDRDLATRLGLSEQFFGGDIDAKYEKALKKIGKRAAALMEQSD